ncbi:MAG: class I SAM-dependent methyltransferase [Alphaproteobacteria bacterium]
MNTNKSDKPSNWVTRFAPLIETGGRVLDLACGNGRHSIFLASSGFYVTAVDRDIPNISEKFKQIRWIEADLENGDQSLWEKQHFNAVVVTNYLYRPLIPAIINALDGNGVLIYETLALVTNNMGAPQTLIFYFNLVNFCRHVREDCA